mmetsp:Transcript_21543/g.60154  ORF Transcript_21543/g.60154 Transcript_21543/m.60154 type:complete len:335 (-) Transcript_21543:1510-2514(-)
MGSGLLPRTTVCHPRHHSNPLSPVTASSSVAVPGAAAAVGAVLSGTPEGGATAVIWRRPPVLARASRQSGLLAGTSASLVGGNLRFESAAPLGIRAAAVSSRWGGRAAGSVLVGGSGCAAAVASGLAATASGAPRACVQRTTGPVWRAPRRAPSRNGGACSSGARSAAATADAPVPAVAGVLAASAWPGASVALHGRRCLDQAWSLAPRRGPRIAQAPTRTALGSNSAIVVLRRIRSPPLLPRPCRSFSHSHARLCGRWLWPSNRRRRAGPRLPRLRRASPSKALATRGSPAAFASSSPQHRHCLIRRRVAADVEALVLGRRWAPWHHFGSSPL